MAAPWLKYQATAPARKPWEKYAAAAKPAAAENAPDPTGSFGENALAGFGQSAVNTGRGLKQASTDAARYFMETGLGIPAPGLRASLASQQADIDESRRLDASLNHTWGGGVGNAAGQVAQLAVPVGEVAGIGKLVAGAGKAAAYGASQPVASDETRGGNAAEQGAWGLGGAALSKVAGAAASKAKPVVDVAKKEALELLDRLGIPVHLSQTMDSGFLKLVSSVANKFPGSGVVAAGRNQAAKFSNALGDMMGLKGVTSLSDDVIAAAKRRTSRAYDTLFDRNSVNVTPATASKLQAISQQASSDLTPDKAKIVQNQINKFLSKADENGQIPGRAYQNIRLGMKALESNPEHGHLVQQVRKVMEGAANESMQGNDAALMRQVNGQFANRKIVEKALKQVSGAAEQVKPSSLWALVNQSHGSTAEMRALARAGQLVLKDGIPDSGTSQREMVNRLLGLGPAGTAGLIAGLPIAAKGVAGAAVIGRALNSPTAARLIPRAGGQTLNALARVVKPAPLLLPAVAEARKKQKRP